MGGILWWVWKLKWAILSHCDSLQRCANTKAAHQVSQHREDLSVCQHELVSLLFLPDSLRKAAFFEVEHWHLVVYWCTHHVRVFNAWAFTGSHLIAKINSMFHFCSPAKYASQQRRWCFVSHWVGARCKGGKGVERIFCKNQQFASITFNSNVEIAFSPLNGLSGFTFRVKSSWYWGTSCW